MFSDADESESDHENSQDAPTTPIRSNNERTNAAFDNTNRNKHYHFVIIEESARRYKRTCWILIGWMGGILFDLSSFL